MKTISSDTAEASFASGLNLAEAATLARVPRKLTALAGRLWSRISGARKAGSARRAALSGALCRAAHRGDAREIASLLAQGADATARDEDGMTPLMICALSASRECVALLVPESDCSAIAPGGFCALHWACFSPLSGMSAMGCATMASAQSAVMESIKERAESCALILMGVCDPRARSADGKRASSIADEAGCGGVADRLRAMERAMDERKALGEAANDAVAGRGIRARL